MKRTKGVKTVLCWLVMMLFVVKPVSLISQSSEFAQFEQAKDHFKKGIHFFNQMNYLAAVEFFRKALSVYSEYYVAREYLARSYKLAGYTDSALKEWEQLYTISENPAVKNKIDNLRFQEVNQAIDHTATENFLLVDSIRSVSMGRFHFAYPIDIVLDNEKNMYITSFSTGKVVKIASNKTGRKVYSPEMQSKIYGIDYYKNTLMFSDFSQNVVYLADADLQVHDTIGHSGLGNGEFHGPQGVAFDEKGFMYVVDSGNHRVQKFAPDKKFIVAFGSQGKYEGELQNPTDIVVLGEDVYVTDTGNNRIVHFDHSGNFIDAILVKGLKKPRGITARDRMLFISDEESGLLEYNTVDTTTRWVKKWGKEDDGFSRLTSVAFDRDNYLYAIDHNKERILIFSPQKSLYSNLDLEITSVDTGKFPVIACYVNIRKRDGSPVYGLTKDNFTVMEDSARMSGLYINYLKDQAASVSIVLCVDRSLAAKGWHNELSWSADFILKNMRKNDVVKVSNFNSDVWSSHDFDWSRRRALREIRKRAYRKGKKIGKALYNALSDVLRKQDRRAVVMLTDGSVGDDSFSQYSVRHIIHYAQSHFIPIYIIYFKEKNPVLQQIARETGGAFIKAAAVDSMRRVYDTIKKSEEHRYVIVYSTLKTKSFKGWWSDVTIKVDMKGQQGLEWGGYFVPE